MAALGSPDRYRGCRRLSRSPKALPSIYTQPGNAYPVYTGVETFPMLPEELSTDLTSLVEGADRPAMIVDISVTADGVVQSGQAYRALVRNCAQLTYNGVGSWLEKTMDARSQGCCIRRIAAATPVAGRGRPAFARQAVSERRPLHRQHRDHAVARRWSGHRRRDYVEESRHGADRGFHDRRQ